MNDVIGLENYLQFVIALALVLGLIGLFAFAAKRFGLGAVVTPRAGKPAKRLALSEIMQVDGKRRLILVRRDEAEHLILLGPTTDLLIEKNIVERGETTFENALQTAAETADNKDAAS